MAWIKVEYETPDKVEMLAVASRLSNDARVIFYHWFHLWTWADANVGEDGFARGATLAWLSRKAGLNGVAEAFAAEGWLQETDSGVLFKDFWKHNGQSAKQRGQTAKRQTALRKSRESNADSNAQSNGTAVTQSISSSYSSSVSVSGSSSEPKPKRKSQAEEDPLFARFWGVYPCKAKKGPSRKRWGIVVRTVDPEVVIAAAEKYAASYAGAHHPAHALTWLNQERWTDDPASWEVKYGQNGRSREPTEDERRAERIERMKRKGLA